MTPSDYILPVNLEEFYSIYFICVYFLWSFPKTALTFLSRGSTSSVHEALGLETASTGGWQKRQLFAGFQTSLGESFRNIWELHWLGVPGSLLMGRFSFQRLLLLSALTELLLAVSWLGAAAALVSSWQLCRGSHALLHRLQNGQKCCLKLSSDSVSMPRARIQHELKGL